MTVLLRLLEGEKTYGERRLFRQAHLRLSRGERAVLLGPNGVGKSTLFRGLAGLEPLDAGKIERASKARFSDRQGVRVFYLPQDFRPLGGRVRELAYQATPLWAAEQALEAAPPERAAEAWERVQELAFWKGRIGRVLGDFGIGRQLWDQDALDLSGGEGVRLGLALAFLSGAEVLLLDEPTTHLDLQMRLRLEGLLEGYPGAVGMISHDRALIARVATTVYYLEAGLLQRVAGGYETYMQEKERILRTVEKARHEAIKERLRLLQAVPDRRRPGTDRRVREKAQLAVRAQRIQAPDPLPPERRWSLEIRAEGTPRLVAEGKELSKSYSLRPTSNAEGPVEVKAVLRGVSFRIFRGDRIALLGPNGAGKTTLLRLLLSRERPDGGECALMPGVRTAYLDQHHHGLEPHIPLFAQFTAHYGEARAAMLLGRMGFRPPRWFDPPSAFSGGERARAGLALLAGIQAGLLVLDEPTNHLELELLEALERALVDYPGTLLFVSHDRALVQKVATRFWGIEGGRLVEYPGYPEAEAAMLGRGAVRLDPLGELPQELLTPPQERDLEEERLVLFERLEDPRLTERERARVRAELVALEEELFQKYAREFYLPPRYTHRVVCRGVEVYADVELDFYRFWSREGSLSGERVGGAVRLWGQASEATLAGALQILFELEDVGLVVYEGRVFAFSAYDKRFVRTLPKTKRRRRHRGAWAEAVRTG